MALKRSDAKHALPRQEMRHAPRDAATLLQELHAEQAPIRRWAARDLGAYPEAAEALLGALNREVDDSVCEALFCSLEQIAHHLPISQASSTVTQGLIVLLRSESAVLRNEAINVLQLLPDQVAPYLDRLLDDNDVDVRIFALDILRALPHPSAPRWVTRVLMQETHVNVLGAAVDRATELGAAEMQPALERLLARPNLPAYLRFATRMALERIDADEAEKGVEDKDAPHG
ncbi:MAG: HEAT repeat domain-containing protein [Pseudomonadota bacterium]